MRSSPSSVRVTSNGQACGEAGGKARSGAVMQPARPCLAARGSRSGSATHTAVCRRMWWVQIDGHEALKFPSRCAGQHRLESIARHRRAAPPGGAMPSGLPPGSWPHHGDDGCCWVGQPDLYHGGRTRGASVQFLWPGAGVGAHRAAAADALCTILPVEPVEGLIPLAKQPISHFQPNISNSTTRCTRQSHLCQRAPFG